MKRFLFFILIFSSGKLFGQTEQYDQIALKRDYSETQRNLYNSSNSSEDLISRQNKYFGILYSFIQQYSKSENVLYLLEGAVNLRYSQFDSLYYLLDSSLKKSPYFGSVYYARKRLQVAETGKKFPVLQLTDTLGNITGTHSFQNNFVLLDLWSSWCKTCRAQIPDLRKLYSKYHSKGFEIIGISVDENKQAWLDAAKKDKQYWKQYCELVPWGKNSLIVLFNIMGIPVNFLLDREGTLVGQDLSAEQIENIISR